MTKIRSLQQAYLDGWERCRLTAESKLVEMIEAGRITENVANSVNQVLFSIHNPTIEELNEWQDGGWQRTNEVVTGWRGAIPNLRWHRSKKFT